MYRNTTVGSLPLGLSRRLLTQCCSLFVCLMLCCGMALWGGLALHAQSTAGGGIQGTITDPTGAVVRDAEVTATNTDTGVATTKKTNKSGRTTSKWLPKASHGTSRRMFPSTTPPCSA